MFFFRKEKENKDERVVLIIFILFSLPLNCSLVAVETPLDDSIVSANKIE